ncbi:hypothetical protein OH76DRAFT_1400979 [Lentinus brumalis]|uniref:F-box domain-containing protein n=1 Tax=Lentinus brumalis TaxID=2498619 RepID=A0A371DHP7_9APHY|nr:hypothetical protein OH76DRAFT_1400979 [Polyporus brumalis]
MPAPFLELPTELRLQIYEHFFTTHQHVSQSHQPTNAHIRLLYVCRQITDEAGTHFRHYISLRTEHQISAFILYAAPQFVAQIEWADVANDGRVFQSADENQEDTPLSNLHLALARMTALRRLRVFQCTQGLPINLRNTMSLHRSRRLGLKFERAMFPKGLVSPSYYELYLDPDTRIDLYDAVDPSNIVALRLSGEIISSSSNPSKRECDSAQTRSMSGLRHVTLHSITGNYFDRQSIEECFPGAQLESFTYALGHRLGFEIRNHHVESLASAHGRSLRKLVLLGCSRLSSANITQALENMPFLEYFALHLFTVDELRSNFIRSLPLSLAVLKIQVMNAWYAVALTAEEESLCEAIETDILLRNSPLQHVCASFRTALMIDGGRHDRWEQIAASRNVRLDLGPWEHEMVQDV